MSSTKAPDLSNSAKPATREPSNAPSTITSKLFAGSATRFPYLSSPRPRGVDFQWSGCGANNDVAMFNHQLFEWVLPPLVISPFGAHQRPAALRYRGRAARPASID